MPASNDPNWLVFKGDHPYFEDGVPYTYRMYSDWSLKNQLDGGVKISTIKGRLSAAHFCQPDHLLAPKTLKDKVEKNTELRGFCKEARDARLISSRFDSPKEAFSQKWLSRKLL